MDKEYLVSRLHALQKQLNELVSGQDKLTDPAVVALSEEADRLIVELQRKCMKESALRRSADKPSRFAAQPAEKTGQQLGAFFLEQP
jgi:U3 small nucleolar RNA-associated protein 14